MKILLMCFTLISVASISGFTYSCAVNGNGSQITQGDNNENDKGNISESGGKFNNLTINNDYHLIEPVLKKLNFNNKTVLHEITNEMINNALHSNNEFKNLKAQILNGSNTIDGKLNLKLFGLYKGEKIDSNISIAGFVDKDYFQNIKIGNYQLNSYNWFNDSLPIVDELISSNSPNKLISEIENISSSNLNKYI